MSENPIATLLDESERKWQCFQNEHRNGADYDLAGMMNLYSDIAGMRHNAARNIRNWLAYNEKLLEYAVLWNECSEDVKNKTRLLCRECILRYANRFGMSSELAGRICKMAKENRVYVICENEKKLDGRKLMDLLKNVAPGESFALSPDTDAGFEAVRDYENMVVSLAENAGQPPLAKDRYMSLPVEKGIHAEGNDTFAAELLQAGIDLSRSRFPFGGAEAKKLFLKLSFRVGDSLATDQLQKALADNNQWDMVYAARSICNQALNMGYVNVGVYTNNLFLCTILPLLTEESIPADPDYQREMLACITAEARRISHAAEKMYASGLWKD